MNGFEIDDGIKDAMQMIEDNSAIDRTFENVIESAGSQFAEIETQLSSIPGTINGVADDIMAKAKGIETQLTTAVNRLPAFAAHVEGQFNNLMSNINTFASSQALKNALSGKAGCSEMKSFFGSITSEGRKLMGDVNALVGDVKGEINKFKQLGQELQTTITSTKDGLINQLNAEITATTNLLKKSELEALKTRVVSEFQTGIADARAELSRDVMNKLSATGKANVQALVGDMRLKDFDILTSGESLSSLAKKIDTNTASLQEMVLGEQNAMMGAVTQLERFGAVSSMKSLLGNNSCVNTIMGFVGKTDFLKKLGG